MSGLEIVGIVLSTIPLIIAGLDHYAGGVDVIKVIRHFSQEFRALARKLEAESVVFRNTLTILLHECVEVRVQKALMDDITGKAWSGREVEQALRRTLKDSYTSYIEYVRNIHEALDSFRQRLHIDQSGKPPFDGPRSFRQAYNRFRFALEKSAYLDLIKDIK